MARSRPSTGSTGRRQGFLSSTWPTTSCRLQRSSTDGLQRERRGMRLLPCKMLACKNHPPAQTKPHPTLLTRLQPPPCPERRLHTTSRMRITRRDFPDRPLFLKHHPSRYRLLLSPLRTCFPTWVLLGELLVRSLPVSGLRFIPHGPHHERHQSKSRLRSRSRPQNSGHLRFHGRFRSRNARRLSGLPRTLATRRTNGTASQPAPRCNGGVVQFGISPDSIGGFPPCCPPPIHAPRQEKSLYTFV